MIIIPAIFEERAIRRLDDEKTETWFFSGVDIVRVLTRQVDFQTARKSWNKQMPDGHRSGLMTSRKANFLKSMSAV